MAEVLKLGVFFDGTGNHKDNDKEINNAIDSQNTTTTATKPKIKKTTEGKKQ
jgi:hypothetical protein